MHFAHTQQGFSIASRNFQEDLWLAQQSPQESSRRNGPLPRDQHCGCWTPLKRFQISPGILPPIWKFCFRTTSLPSSGAFYKNTPQSPPLPSLALLAQGRWWTTGEKKKKPLEIFGGWSHWHWKCSLTCTSWSYAYGSSSFALKVLTQQGQESIPTL